MSKRARPDLGEEIAGPGSSDQVSRVRSREVDGERLAGLLAEDLLGAPQLARIDRRAA